MQACGLNSLVICFDVRTHDGGKHDNEERDLNKEHPFPRVSRYKRGGDNKEVDISELRA